MIGVAVITFALTLAALLLALVAQFIARGKDLTAWAVILLGLALLWARLA